MDLGKWRAAVLAAHAAADSAEGLRLAEAARADLPARRGITVYWRSCFLALAGRPAEALGALEAGMVEGAWWDPDMLDTDPDLAALRPLPGFAALRGECERRRLSARTSSRPRCLVISPSTASWDPRSVLFIHGRGDTAREFARIWQPLVDQGWTLVVPQSSQPHDSESFCWDDRELALQEIRRHLEDCAGKWGLPADGMVAAGASQGASLATDIAREAGLPWLCLIPTFPRTWDPSRPAAPAGHERGSVIIGETDQENARSLRVVESLRASGIPVSVRTMKGIGHELPVEASTLAAEALRELVGASPAGELLSEGP